MKEQSQKPGAGIAFLGFLLTFLLTVTLLLDGVLLGLKTTIFRGTDIVDVLKNANLFQTVTEVVVSEVSTATDSDFLKDAAESVLSEDIMVEMAEDVTAAIQKNKDVDLSNMKDACLDAIKDLSEEVVDDVLSQVKKGSGELNRDSLAGNETVQELQSMYGVDITGIVMDYVEETYGASSVNVDEIDLKEAKAEAKKTINRVVIPSMEGAVDTYLEQINRTVNKEIRTINRRYDISGTLDMVETGMRWLTTAIIILSVVSAVFLLLEFVTYLKYEFRAFRNIGIASLITGVIVLLLGGVLLFAKNFITGIWDLAGDLAGAKAEQVIMDFIERNMAVLSYRILLIGGIVVLLSIVSFVVSGLLKKKD